jgi:hypothetical protein|tara:strand:- start:94 stop:1236 length:1143 start_codon:yes stop_codon:yes gene_type:complete
LIKSCPVCSKKKFKNIFSHNRVPEYLLNYSNNFHDALTYKSVPVNFVECIECGFLFNKINTQLSYSTEYDANRSFSKEFNNYLNDIISYLEFNIFKKYKISNILEIGHGDGILLKNIFNLKKYNFKNIIGYDPSGHLSHKNNQKTLKFFKKYYTKKNIVKPDLVILRHTLEHISNVKNFLKLILNENPKFVFIEVPCKTFVYNGNIHYYSNEHCSYFDYYSLQVLLKFFGYKKYTMKKAFNDENLISIFIKSDEKIEVADVADNNPISNPKQNLVKFKKQIINNFNFKYDFFWGAAGKGVMVLNMLNITYKQVPYIVDVNENIQGKFISLSGTEIISQHSLQKYIHSKSKIFIMNKVYKDEIKKILLKLKIKNKVYSLFH